VKTEAEVRALLVDLRECIMPMATPGTLPYVLVLEQISMCEWFLGNDLPDGLGSLADMQRHCAKMRRDRAITESARTN
jgi:hypothetical protein